MKDHYLVSVARVPGVSRLRMQSYIQEAVAIWGGQLAPSNPREICPVCTGLNKMCKVCDGTGAVPSEQEGDPLGPPCRLMEKGAVTVKILPRNQEDATRKHLRKYIVKKLKERNT